MFNFFGCGNSKEQPQELTELDIIKSKMIFAFAIAPNQVLNISENRAENKLSILVDNITLAVQLRDLLHTAQKLETDSGLADEIQAQVLQESSDGPAKGNAKLVIVGNAVDWFGRYIATKAEEKCCVLTCTLL